jgi:hypothetical protein
MPDEQPTEGPSDGSGRTAPPREGRASEVLALADLSRDLRRQRARLTYLRQAEEQLESGFATRLRRDLLAAHPQSRSLPAAQTPRLARRTRAYRAILLPVLLLVTLVTGLNAYRHSSPARQTASSRSATSTILAARSGIARPGGRPVTAGMAEAPRHAASFGTSAKAPNVAPAATRGGQGLAAATVPVASGPAVPRALLPASTLPRSAAGIATPTQAQARGRILLPAALPSLPRAAPAYPLRYSAFSAAQARAIVKSFPGLQLHSAGLYLNGRVSLRIEEPARDHLVYQSLSRSAAGPRRPVLLAPALARDRAAAWLVAHHLLPPGTTAAGMRVAFDSAARTVTIGPPPPPGLAAANAPMGVTLRLDGEGQVSAADVRWPLLGHPTSIILRTLPVAVRQAETSDLDLAAAGTPPFLVEAVSLVYQPSGSGQALAWSPSYRLRGHLAGSDRPTSRYLPASASP